MTSQPLILLVEDEAHLADALLFNLRAENYRVHHEADGDAALDWVLHSGEPVSAILLDCMLPGLDGFQIARTLRSKNNFVPILMLTARGRPEDVLAGFEAGADDYLPKPFDLAILLARLGGLLRRLQWQGAKPAFAATGPSIPPAPEQPTETPDTILLNGRSIHFDSLEIRSGERITRLTLMEAELLRYLLDRRGKVVSRKEILEEVWRVREDTDTRAIDNFVVRLRRYLEDDPAKPVHLLTVRGIGYRFAALPAA